jgi:CBS domain-containing protein
MEVARCRVFTNDGELETTRCRPVERVDLPRVPTIADHVRISEIMSTDVVCARPDLDIAAVTELLVDNHIGCIPIVDSVGRPKGIVTKLDLLDREWPGMTAGDVMMPLAITLNLNATVAHAAAVMGLEDFHHVMVIAPDGTLAGVVSTMDVCRWLARNDGFMAR